MAREFDMLQSRRRAQLAGLNPSDLQDLYSRGTPPPFDLAARQMPQGDPGYPMRELERERRRRETQVSEDLPPALGNAERVQIAGDVIPLPMGRPAYEAKGPVGENRALGSYGLKGIDLLKYLNRKPDLLDVLQFPSGLPARQMGGPVAPGQPYMVGEKGPETYLPTSAMERMHEIQKRRLSVQTQGLPKGYKYVDEGK